MGLGDLSRVNTNVQALQAYNNLQKTNSNLGLRQMRLSTGSRLNRAEDDSAGYSISKKLEARTRGQAQALSNIGDAKSMLTVAEGSLNSIMDILQTMKEKAVQASNDSMGAQERDAIEDQLDELTKEIKDIVTGTTFNGKDLLRDISGNTVNNASFSFQVGASGGTASSTLDSFNVQIDKVQVTANSAGDTSGLFDEILTSTGSLTTTDIGSGFTASDETWSVGNADNARDALARIDGAINKVATNLAGIGDAQKRLSFKQENLMVSMNNYEAARSRIADADFAREQMEIVKLQILQQTGVATLAQSNAAPQSVLSLMGG